MIAQILDNMEGCDNDIRCVYLKLIDIFTCGYYQVIFGPNGQNLNLIEWKTEMCTSKCVIPHKILSLINSFRLVKGWVPDLE